MTPETSPCLKSQTPAVNWSMSAFVMDPFGLGQNITCQL